MKYKIRPMQISEYYLLEKFLYEAIFQRDASNLLPESIIFDPDIYIYIEDFGSKNDDYCLCAECENKIIGAVWVRIIDGFGSIDKETPEFAISLYKEYRGFGIGTAMIKRMLDDLRKKSYMRASLAVQ